MKIRRIMVIFMVGLSVLPILLFSIIISQHVYNQHDKSLEVEFSSYARQANYVIESFYKDSVNSLVYISDQHFVKNLFYSDKKNQNNKINEFRSYGKALVEKNQYIDNVILTDNRNSYITSIYKVNNDMLNKVLGKDNLIMKDNFSEFFMAEGKSTPVFIARKPFYDETAHLKGNVICVYNSIAISNLIETIKNKRANNIVFIDFNGNVLSYPYNRIQKYSENVIYNPIKNKISSAYNNNYNYKANKKYNNNGAKKWTFIDKNSVSNGLILVTANQDILFSSYNEQHSVIIFVSTTLCIIALISTLFFVHFYTVPMKQLLSTLRLKQRGDKFARFDVNTNNEYQELSDAFNDLIDDISESENTYRTVVEMNDNIVFEYNIIKDIVKFSENFNEKFSFRAKTLSYRDSFIFNAKVHPKDVRKYKQTLVNLIKMKSLEQGEFRFKSIYGDYVWYMLRMRMLYDSRNLPYKVVGVMVDIDNAKKKETAFVKKAEYDALTGLLNRATFEKRLVNEFELARVRKKIDALFFVDIDDFKIYNDKYGHACGDEVLVFIAKAIKLVTENYGFSGRYGGDEFLFCITSQDSQLNMKKFASDVISELNKGFFSNIVCKQINVSCSIGISFFSESGSNIDSIIEEADQAMYEIKKSGKSDYAIFDK